VQRENPIPLLDRVFDPEYRRNLNKVTLQVPLLRALYLLCIPLSKTLVRLGWSPTSITHVSNLLAVGSVAALIWAENPWLFPALWLAALFFDIADGIVARTTGQASATGSFYDHMSDQVKVMALFLGAGLRYDTTTIWILCYAVGTGFLFMTVVNQIYALRSLRLSVRAGARGKQEPEAAVPPPAAETRGALRSFVRRHPRLRSTLIGIHASIFVMYGNSMLLVLPLAFGETWAIATLAFFGLITLRSLLLVLKEMVKVNRQFAHAGVPWK
jgi:phosphatidylglycerophosphate synthase